MASFWQNKSEMTGCDDRKTALKNIVSIGVSCTATKIKMEEADILNSQNKLEKAYEVYKAIIREKPGHAGALFGIGIILEKTAKI